MNTDKIYDLLIVGAGPAGLTAAIYGLRYNMDILVVGGVPGGLVSESHEICNWPGDNKITGAELSVKMFKHAQDLGAEIVIDIINSINKTGDNFEIKTASGKNFKAKQVLLTLGTDHRKLGLPEEAGFAGRGVTYCATCDGMFFKGKNVAVVGGGNSAMTAALFLADICPQVYLIYRGTELKGEVTWMQETDAKKNIIKISQTNIIKLSGENKLQKITLDKPYNNSAEIAVEGLFVEVGTLPKTELFKSLGGELDEFGNIKVNIDQSTNIPGVWAAGDGTSGSNHFRQIVTAVSEGAIAADSIFKALKAKK